MNGWLIPFAVIASTSKERRGRLAETLLPAVVPVAATQRIAVATIAADQQIRSAERREANVAAEAVSAVETVSAKEGEDKTLTDDELRTLPTLSVVLNRVPDLRQRINTAGNTVNLVNEQLANEIINTFKIAKGKTASDDLADADKLTAAQLATLPQLSRLFNRYPALKGKVIKPSGTSGGGTLSSVASERVAREK